MPFNRCPKTASFLSRYRMEDFNALEVPDRRAQLLAWLTPTRKIALVGGVTLLPALGVGLMLNGLFFPTASSQARPEPPKLTARMQNVSPIEPPVGEIDRLKAQVALADQQKLLERLATPTLPAAKPTPRPVRIVPPPQTPQTLPVLPPPQAAPRQWHELASLGSATEDFPAGRVAPVAMAGVSAVGAPANLAVSVSTPTPPARMTATSLDPALEAGVDTGGYTTQPVSLVGGATRPAIAATTLATGILERPILWEERTGVRGSESERHVVVLTESLGAGSAEEDGPQLAEGTRILAVVQDISANGVVTMQAVALRVDDREVPLQGVSIRAVGGLPLMASRNDKGQEFSTLDSGQALLKGAERGFDTFNRPTSLNQIFTPGGSNFSASYGRDPLAALGAGVFGELAETVRERNRQAVRQIQSRPDLWYLPGGTAVELLFGREISL
ncbi:MAG: hypothetical protein H7Y22_06565 [Gemmatimonadaceae bacterium]|nr:hypothetical protein [Gloeobacterales cyanobacterium ES-bin-141]